ncbi:hypothetical protein N7510_001226 [Penicillium lagena]|uniref:uncharacterized protein n=1 Tax=Penicillium lagena TaxID=94218 RepID=UPI0025426531|nr:uncharacterized protein N7510_001226 [Penicillium lagena]KAJ5624917.1 hypothetical protein N7510_001226 [Penicillium lagena]
MALVQPLLPTSRRVGASKSRSGCKTCKIRKVKCGEEKPACLRCSTTGRKCEYDGGVTSSPPASSTQSSLIVTRTLSLSPNSGRRERRAFEYYFQHAAQFLAGGMDVDFWTGVVPQICRSEPAVWDAMISISALFENPDQCPDFTFLRQQQTGSLTLPQNHKDALMWYSRSMSSIHEQIERGTADPYIALISCVLFISIEIVQGRLEEALQLYWQGVSLIQDLRTNAHFAASATKAALLENTIIPLFMRLNTIALTISGTPASEILTFAESHMVQGFTSLDSARLAIVALSAEAMLFERETYLHIMAVAGDSRVDPEFLTRQHNLQARLDHWLRAYTNLVEALLPLSYDAHLPTFQMIVEQASLILSISAGPDGAQPPFTFEMGVGLPLYLTALRCRDPILRRRALHLLRQSPKVQSFFKCTPVALFAEVIMNLEERYSASLRSTGSTDHDDSLAPLSSRIPEEARIISAGVFKPQNGPPHGYPADEFAEWLEGEFRNWNRNPDQLVLRFCRGQHYPEHDTWRLTWENVPI